MIHYTCDRCERPIDPAEELRYIIRVDVEVIASGPDELDDEETIDYLSDLNDALEEEMLAATQDDETDDSLDFLHDALSRGDDLDHFDNAFASTISSAEHPEQAAALPSSFDLCPQCYANYLKNPLSRGRSLKLHFSDN